VICGNDVWDTAIPGSINAINANMPLVLISD